jgi:hypothetical protein
MDINVHFKLIYFVRREWNELTPFSSDIHSFIHGSEQLTSVNENALLSCLRDALYHEVSFLNR